MSPGSNSRRGSTMVAAGILLSRISGLVRQKAFGFFFGVGPLADAFTAAFRIPNLMQNLLGEGVLSASFIPVYSRLLDEGREEDAGRVAGAVAGLLAVAAGAVTLLAIVFASPLTSLLAPGFTGARRDLTVSLIRIITPGVGVLVLSAWCLGVLNSHRRFFLAYVAPVLWNLVQVVVLVGAAVWLLDDPWRPAEAALGDLERLARALGVGTLLGGLAQFGIQVRPVLRVEPRLRLSLRRDLPGVREVLRAFTPVVTGRGVVQLSAYLDLFLASLLATGAVAALAFAQQLHLLPVSLFGMSVAAAELPELARAGALPAPELRARLDTALARMGFWVVGTATIFVTSGDLLAGVLFGGGRFGRDGEVVVWIVLVGFTIGLLPTTASRLLQNSLYALGDARTPARIAALRVTVSAAVGVLLMFQLDRFGLVDGAVVQLGDLPGWGPLSAGVRTAAEGEVVLRLGALGLTLAASAGAVLEYVALHRAVRSRTGAVVHAGGRHRGRLVLPVAVAVVVALLMRRVVGDWPRLLGGSLAVLAVGVAYVATATRTRVDEAAVVVRQLRRRVLRR